MMKSRDIFLIIAIALIFVLSFFLDKTILRFMFSIRNDTLTSIAVFLSSITGTLMALVWIIIFAVWTKKSRKNIPLLILSLWLSALSVLILKNVINRPRPDITHLVIETDSSFPSGHANSVFSLYPILSKNYKVLSIFWIVFSILVALSRLYLGVHYFSDVIFGAINGLFFGYLTLYLEKRYNLTKNITDKLLKKL